VLPLDDVLLAYASGWFPMADDDGRIRWYSPDPRGILPLDAVHVPKRLARTLRHGSFVVRLDTAFDDVIRACAMDREEGTWISGEIVDTYAALHRRGFAHSIEVWQDERLVGGLYGVALRGAFFGESMFHRVTDASKVALVALTGHLRARGYQLLDVQWVTPHLERFGAIEISRRDYLRRLARAIEADAQWTV
jgi:leucyl/phenylalanyl-tRNA--protein transferase